MSHRPPSIVSDPSFRLRLAAALGWAAAGLLLVSLLLPYWQVRLFAPQYREGLTATMYAYKVAGDVDEINGLNHYVGVAKLETLGRVERAVAVPGVLALALLAAFAFRPGGRGATALKAAAVASFPFIFMADLKFWMHHASTHLDPTAPLKFKAFTMQVLGSGKIGQFHSQVWPQAGFYLALAAAAFMLAGLWLTRRPGAGASKAILLALLALTTKGARAESLQGLLDAAVPGTVLELAPGTYSGPVAFTKPVTVRGGGRAVIDGGGRGTVLRIQAPSVTLEGVTIRGSGASMLLEDSGIRVDAASAAIRNCVLEDVLFGFFVDGVPGTVMERNVLRGKPLDMGVRGDLLRAWKADRTVFRGNDVSGGRDVVLWFSTGSVVEGNTVAGGRYGLHFMYTNDAKVTGNSFTDNSVGFYIMYSRGVLVEGNRFARHRGPSGAGLGLKESGMLTVRGNVFDSNRQGVYIDQSPMNPDDANLFERNLLAHNDVGMSILPGVRGNAFLGNSFEDNLQQVSVRGGGALKGNEWSRDGRGNHWSDYAGWGAPGAAVGAVPYRADDVVERLFERTPAAAWFRFTPAASVMELASRAFPIFAPRPTVVDEHPLLASEAPGLPPEAPRQASAPLAAAAGLFMLSGLTAWSASRGGRFGPALPKTAPAGAAAVSARGVGKSFGSRRILDGVSFELAPRSSLVLWGANGAGKSTFIKCLLGLHRHEGELSLFGLDSRARGAEARARVGYVPQHAAGYDWSVGEAMEFVCAVRGADPEGIPAALTRAGLRGENTKSVGDLSGGMRQKLALAQALIAEPELLVLDEPCANLDLASRRDFLSALRGLKASRALLMTSHRLEEVEMIADRVLWLEEGRPARLLDVVDFLAEAEAGRPLWLLLERDEDGARAIARLAELGISASPNGRGVWAEVAPGRTMEAVRGLESAGIAVRDLRRGGWS